MDTGIKTHAKCQKEKQIDTAIWHRMVVRRWAVFCLVLLGTALLFPNGVNAQNITWQPINHGLYGGQVNKILKHPSAALFARTEGETTQIYRSGGAGATWSVLAPTEVDNFAIGPDGILLVATKETFLYSTDEGETWISAVLPRRFYRGLVVNEEGAIFGAGTRGIYKSTDSGQNWILLDNGLPSDVIIRHLVITKNGTLFIGTGWDGLFRSIDNGATWERSAFAGVDIRFLTASIDGSVFVHLSLSGDFRNEPFTGLQWSVDEGVTWTVVDTGYHEYRGGNVFADAISVGPSGNLWVASPGGGISKSMDNGTTWMPVGKVDNVWTSEFTFTEAGEIFLGTRGEGIFRFNDEDQTWEPSNTGLTATQITTLNIDPNGDVWIYAGGLYRSSDKGASWRKLEITEDGPGGTVTEILFGNQGEIYTFPELFQSNNDGMTWQELPFPPTTGGIYDLQVASEGHLYAGASDGLFRLSDSQDEWVQLSDAIHLVHAISFATNGDMLVGTAYNFNNQENGVFRSSDEGITWESMLMEPFKGGIRAFAVSQNGTILAGSEDSGVYRSEDDGYNFSAIWEPRTLCCFGNFAVATGGEIYSGTRNGIFLSIDDGKNWEDITQDLPTRYLSSVAIDEEGFVYLGTHGAGVYRSSTAVASSRQEVQEVPRNGSLFDSSYPNPFQPQTTIAFTLPQAAYAEVKIYNLLGEEVVTLQKGYLAGGRHEAVWRPTGLPSGVYFGRIEAAGRSETFELLLVK